VLCSLQAVVNIHEASRLLAITPNFNLMTATHLCLNHLPAHGGRGFFPSTIVSPVGPIHVVVAGNPRYNAKILPEMTAHPFAKELFPPVAVLRHTGISV